MENLVIRGLCSDLVLASLAAVDLQNYQSLKSLFASTAILKKPDGTLLQGSEAIVASYVSRDADRLTRHVISNHTITIDASQTQVHSFCMITLWVGHYSDAQSTKGRPLKYPLQLGTMEDQLVLTELGWRIQRRDALFLLHAL